MRSPSTTDGDTESLKQVRQESADVCGGLPPLGIHCRTVEGIAWYEAKQLLRERCTIDGGLVCLNSENEAGCKDYEVKTALIAEMPPTTMADRAI